MVEFTKDGKVILTTKFMGIEKKDETTYKVEGDKLTVAKKGKDGKDDESTIKSISGDTMVLVDKDGKETEFKKK